MQTEDKYETPTASRATKKQKRARTRAQIHRQFKGEKCKCNRCPLIVLHIKDPKENSADIITNTRESKADTKRDGAIATSK